MIRPEAKEAILEWKEIIAGGALTIIGGNWVVNGHTLQPVLGGLMGLLGLALIFIGWRRVRFPMGGTGPGMVEVTERQITYMTAMGGGAVAIDGLNRVEVKTGASGIQWVFSAGPGETLTIPGDAKGAEALFDALVSLPGINYDQAMRAARAPGSLAQGPDSFLIWQKDRKALH
ncbi:MAG: hypothetical protein AAFR53_04865 [Pseudomonadota bacterium]